LGRFGHWWRHCPSSLLFLNEEQWQSLWDSLGKYFSIKRVNVEDTAGWAFRNFTSEVKVYRAICIENALRKNVTLTHLEFTWSEHDFNNHPSIMHHSIIPRLELNRSRPRIAAIRQVPNTTVQQYVVGKALLNSRLRNNLSICFLLLSTSFDVVSSLLGWKKSPLVR
jgi:hypothetical protein